MSCCDACDLRTPVSTIFSFGMGSSLGSGMSFAICKYLTAERYVLLVL